MDSKKFEWLVTKAIDSLPREFRERLENVDIVVADNPTHEQLAELGRKRGETLLGLYEGVPLTKRGHHYGFVVPDKITIFQKPIEMSCRSDSDKEIMARIQDTVRHEIAHYFGISDKRLREIRVSKEERRCSG